MTPRLSSLRFKFITLVVMFGATIVGIAAASLWAFDVLQHELGRPLRSTSQVLSTLAQIKRDAELASSTIGESSADELVLRPLGVRGGPELGATALQPAQERFADTAAGLREHIASLTENEDSVARVGRLTASRIAEHANAGVAGGRTWFDSQQADAALSARSSFFELHELIERAEARLLAEAMLAADHGGRTRTHLVLVLIGAVIAAVLLGVLAVVLLQRWIEQPVARLRVAAEKIGEGDFQHRIDVRGEDELATLGREVNRMAETISDLLEERLRREKLAAMGEMVRRVAHNIRNPLAGIRNLAELTRLDPTDEAETRDSQALIIQTADRLNRWLESLLNATRPLDIEPAEHAVAEWLAEVADAHRASAQSARVSLTVEAKAAPRAAWFDDRHLEHALSALVANAIEATPSGGRVQISATPVDDSGRWTIFVRDEGPGISPELAPRVFDPDFTTKKHGTGTGLALARAVAAAHGGTLTIAAPDPEFRGAGFRLELPVAPPTTSASPGPPVAEAQTAD